MPAKGSSHIVLPELLGEPITPIEPVEAMGPCRYDLWQFVQQVGVSQDNILVCLRLKFVVDLYWDDEVTTANNTAARYGTTRINYPISAILQNSMSRYNSSSTEDPPAIRVTTDSMPLAVVP